MHYWFTEGHMIWMTMWWLLGIGFFLMLSLLLAIAFSGRTESSRSAEEILRRRYASGEIDDAEYRRRLEELRKTKTAA